MRRHVPLLVLGTALAAIAVSAVSAGCASTAGRTDASAAIATWVEPPAVDSQAPMASDPPTAPPASPSTAPSAAPKPTKPAAPNPAPAPAGSTLVQQLLAQVNQLRATNGLPAYKLSAGLVASAHKHNLAMIAPGCGLSHQCPGEATLGARIKAQGVNWHSAGENIGYSGPNANTQAAILTAAKGLTTSMYNEKPPDDGHRKNILSSGFTMVGIDVIRDTKGLVWLTQDFAS
jgi:uncharacterized protein YkwD